MRVNTKQSSVTSKANYLNVNIPAAPGPTIKRNFSPKLKKLGPDSLQITIQRLSTVVDLVGKMLFASLNRKGRLKIDDTLSDKELQTAYTTLKDINDTIG